VHARRHGNSPVPTAAAAAAATRAQKENDPAKEVVREAGTQI